MPAPTAAPAGLPHPPAAVALEVVLGRSMPVALGQVPVLDAPDLDAPGPASGTRPRHSMLAQGLMFSGSVHLAGTLTVAGVLHGQIARQPAMPGADPAGTHVTVSESGQLKGRVRADDIAVLGQATGLLDAAGGRITLHQSARVSGHLRYARLQVNGAVLDARLERVATVQGDRAAGDPAAAPAATAHAAAGTAAA